jgi:putative transposase
MSKPQKKWSADFKLKLVCETYKCDRTIAEIASEHGLHPKQILRWREKLISEAENIFKDQRTQQQADPDKEKLLNIIDQLTLELEFVKKKLKRNG